MSTFARVSRSKVTSVNNGSTFDWIKNEGVPFFDPQKRVTLIYL